MSQLHLSRSARDGLAVLGKGSVRAGLGREVGELAGLGVVDVAALGELGRFVGLAQDLQAEHFTVNFTRGIQRYILDISLDK